VNGPRRCGCSTSPKVRTIERNVTEVVIKARASAASGAWERIKRYYDDGDFLPLRRATRVASAHTRISAGRRCASPEVTGNGSWSIGCWHDFLRSFL